MSDATDAVIDVRDAASGGLGRGGGGYGYGAADDPTLETLALEMLTGGREAVAGVDVLASMVLVDPAVAAAVLGMKASHHA